MIEPVKQELLRRFGENVTIIASDKGLEAVVAELLLKKNLTIATAESCTGGMLAAKLIKKSILNFQNTLFCYKPTDAFKAKLTNSIVLKSILPTQKLDGHIQAVR